MLSSHRLVWTLFGDRADRARDFLWREAEPGLFYILSHRAPEDGHRLFVLDPPKVFAPDLRTGDVLQFSLRANATVARRPAGVTSAAVRGKPADVVMDRLYHLPKGQARAEERRNAIASAGQDWLAARGAKSGFRLVVPANATGSSGCVTSYEVRRFAHDGTAMRIGVLDFDGALIVEDPTKLVQAIGQGFGRAKAFGCGLMLVRRA